MGVYHFFWIEALGWFLRILLRNNFLNPDMRSLVRLAAGARQLSTSAARQGGVADYGGIPMANWPFSVKNRFALTLGFVLFCGSGFSVPFVMVRHQLLKK